MLALAMVTLWGFLRWERRLARRGGDAVLDPALLRQAGFAPGMAVVLAIYATASSFFLCFALLLQAGAGLTPFQAGSLFARPARPLCWRRCWRLGWRCVGATAY